MKPESISSSGEKERKKRKKFRLYRECLKQTQMRWQILLKVILMVFTLPSHLVTTSFHQWIGVLLKLFCHLLGLSFLTIFLFLQLECLLSHNLKVNGHQVCPHRCENTDSPLVCLYRIISLPAQLGRHPYFHQALSIVLAPACFFRDILLCPSTCVYP